MNRLILPLLAAAVLTAGGASAQRPLSPGYGASETLSAGDPRLPDGTRYDLWSFTGRQGERVTVTMRSSSFDTFLAVGTLERGEFRALATDDDGADGTNSRVELRLPYDGIYVIRANSLLSATGPYTLLLQGGGGAAGPSTGTIDWRDEPVADAGGPARSASGGAVEAGERVRGRLSSSDPTLDNGTYFHTYTYHGRRGERLRLTLRSTDFDAYLVLGTPGGRHGIETALARDDDGAGGRDSRVEHVLPHDGPVAIRVTSLLSGSGEYTLDVDSDRPDARRADRWDRDPYAETGAVRDAHGVDPRIVGRWGLTVPGVRVEAADWASVAAAAQLGILEIDAGGGYTWRRDGRIQRGTLRPFTPARGAEPGVAYFLVDDGRAEFYLSLTSYRGRRYMQVNSRATDAVVSYGYRDERR